MKNQGADRHAHAARGHDLYETPPEATRALMQARPHLRRRKLWEPCAGRGAIVRVLREYGADVTAFDLVAYDGADPNIATPVDFLLEQRAPDGATTIVTNPPYKLADAMIRHGLTLVDEVWVLLRLAALEGTKRSDLIDYHLFEVLLGRERLPFMHRDGWDGPKQSGSGAPFAWFCFRRVPSTEPIRLSRISWRVA